MRKPPSGVVNSILFSPPRTLLFGCGLMRGVLRDQTRPRRRMPRRTSRLTPRREIQLNRRVAITVSLDPKRMFHPHHFAVQRTVPGPPPSSAHTAPAIAP